MSGWPGPEPLITGIVVNSAIRWWRWWHMVGFGVDGRAADLLDDVLQFVQMVGAADVDRMITGTAVSRSCRLSFAAGPPEHRRGDRG